MCWSTKFDNYKEPKFAKRGIKVYKIVSDKMNLYKGKRVYWAYYQSNYAYIEGEPTDKIDIVPKTYSDTPFMAIEAGYHSKATIASLKTLISEVSSWFGGHYRVVKCEIPAGTKYYRDENNNVVSEVLIIKRELPKLK